MSVVQRIDVRVQPRASRDEIAGRREGRLVVRVTAPPVDDRANDSVCRLLAKAEGVPRSAVRVVAGARSRDKVIEIDTARKRRKA